MTILLNNKQYRLDVAYLNEDITKATLRAPSPDRREGAVIGETTVTRHVSDPMAGKSKRRVFAFSKLLRKMKLSRQERVSIWRQLWAQMKVPHGA